MLSSYSIPKYLGKKRHEHPFACRRRSVIGFTCWDHGEDVGSCCKPFDVAVAVFFTAARGYVEGFRQDSSLVSHPYKDLAAITVDIHNLSFIGDCWLRTSRRLKLVQHRDHYIKISMNGMT